MAKYTIELTDVVSSNKLSLIIVPKSSRNGFSPVIVNIILCTDLLIASSSLRTTTSLVTGCLLKDKLISLNDLDVATILNKS